MVSIADQSSMLDEPRRTVQRPKEEKPINISEFRVPIVDIEEATGLKFADIISQSDTIGQATQPKVDESLRKIPVRSFEDIKLE